MKKRGRPKGSKNKVKNKVVKKQRKTASPTKKRGRPKKSAKINSQKAANSKKSSKNKKSVKKVRKRRSKKGPRYTAITTVTRRNGEVSYRREVIENKPEDIKSKNDIDMSNVQFGKFLGYCCGRGCQAVITSICLEEGKKNIFICTECGKRGQVSQLKKEAKVIKEKNYDPWKGKK